MKTLKASLMLLLFSSMLAGCSKGGFETLTNTENGSSSQGSSQNDNSEDPVTPPPPVPSAFDKLELSAFVDGGNYDTEQVMSLDKNNKSLLLFLPLPPGPFTNLYLEVPEVKGVKVATALDAQQKARVAISIPLKLIVRDKVNLPPSTTLPGGRPLPMMPSGEYPSLALGLNQASANKVYLYLGINAVGIFVESSYFPEFVGITAPIKNEAGTRIMGAFTIVPKSGPNNGGLFLSFRMPQDFATIIDNHLGGLLN